MNKKIESDICKGCKHLFKKYNICINKKCYIKGKAQLLKKINNDYLKLNICTQNNYFEKGNNNFEENTRYSKYNAKKVTIDNITFDSTSEGNRYCELKLLEKGKLIKDLILQPKFELQLDSKNRYYIADFQYVDLKTNKIIVEDVKGVKTSVYNLKKARFLELYPQYEFREVYNNGKRTKNYNSR